MKVSPAARWAAPAREAVSRDAAVVGRRAQPPGSAVQHRCGLTAAIPMDNPYCSCKLVGGSWLTAAIPMENAYRSCECLQLQSLWRMPTAAVNACSRNPYGECLPQL